LCQQENFIDYYNDNRKWFEEPKENLIAM